MGRQGNTMTGTIKTIIADKGFGFILADGSNDEFFFHTSGCIGLRFDELQKGTRVQFVAGTGAKGPRAESVQLI